MIFRVLKRRITAILRIATGRPVIYGISLIEGRFSGKPSYITESSMVRTEVRALPLGPKEVRLKGTE